MKFYDKSLYKTEQRWQIILTLLITFIIGFFIGYWCRDFETEKKLNENMSINVQENNANE